MKKVEFEYTVGDKVRIINMDKAVGFIVGMQYQDTGIEYDVVYYNDGKRERSNFFPQELCRDEDDKKLGFLK
jgi:hypothetical protein